MDPSSDLEDDFNSNGSLLTIHKLFEVLPCVLDDEFSVTQVNGNLVIQKWNSQFNVLYQLVIKKNLQLLASIQDIPVPVEIQNQPVTSVTKLNDVGDVLQYLEEMKACRNYKRSYAFLCRGFLRPDEHQMCSNCMRESERVLRVKRGGTIRRPKRRLKAKVVDSTPPGLEKLSNAFWDTPD